MNQPIKTHPFLYRIINRRNVIIFGLAVIGGFAFWYFSELQTIYAAIRDYFILIVGDNKLIAGAAFFTLAMLSAVMTFFSSAPVIPIASALLGKTVTLILITSGWLAGGIIAYWICYYLRHFVERLKIFKKADRYQHHLRGKSDFWLMLLFRLAVPAELASYALGLLHYPFWKYVIITILSEIPFAIVALYSTEALLISGEPLAYVGIIVASLIIISVALYLFYKRLKKFGGHPPPEEELENGI